MLEAAKASVSPPQGNSDFDDCCGKDQKQSLGTMTSRLLPPIDAGNRSCLRS
jgi:hypothetical protein